MASLNFRAINKGAGGRRRLSVWHYISWTEYLHSQLSSSSSAAAAEFPARVLQQTVSHHLRCLCKPPPKLRNTVYDRALPASIIYLLSLPPLLVFVFLLRWGKSEAPLHKIYRKHCLWLHKSLIFNRALSWHAGNLGRLLNIHKRKREPCRNFSFVRLAATLLQNPHKQCSFFTRTHACTQTLTVQDFTYTFTSLWGCYCL